jgi:hypothetical protein
MVVAILVGRNVEDLHVAGVSYGPRLLKAVEDALRGAEIESSAQRPTLTVGDTGTEPTA